LPIHSQQTLSVFIGLECDDLHGQQQLTLPMQRLLPSAAARACGLGESQCTGGWDREVRATVLWLHLQVAWACFVCFKAEHSKLCSPDKKEKTNKKTHTHETQ
jgi:hypothetical protein